MSFSLSWILLDVLFEPFLPQHKKNFPYKISGLFPEAKLFLLTSHAATIYTEKRRDKPNWWAVTAVGGGMEKGNPGIAVRLNPAQRGSPAAPRQEFTFLKTSVKQPGNGVHAQSYCIDSGWFIARAVAIYPQYWETE